MNPQPGSLVDYYAEGQIVAGVVLAEEKGRLRLVTEAGREDRIAPGRVLAAYEGNPKLATAPTRVGETSRVDAAAALALEHARQARERRKQIDLSLVWDLLADDGGGRMLDELSELAAGDRSRGALAATLRALLEEKVHFSRRGDLWEPRPRSAVEETLRQRELERRRTEERRRFVAAARDAIEGRAPFARAGNEEEARLLQLLEETAVQGAPGTGSRDVVSLLGELPVPGETPEESAFRTLRALGVFAEDENLFVRRFGLEIALPEWSEEAARRAVAEALGAPGWREGAEGPSSDRPGIPPGLADQIAKGLRRDLTSLEIYSVDDAQTSEIDDALSIETDAHGHSRVGIHIADPGFFLAPGSELDRLAESRAVTFYLPERRVLMLPPPVSEHAAALLPGAPRPALSFFAMLGDAGEILESEIVASVVRSRGRVTYEEADAAVAEAVSKSALPARDTVERGEGSLGEGTGVSSSARERLAALHGVALALEDARVAAGAQIIRAPEVDVSVAPDGTIALKRLEGDGPGRILVSEMMVLAGRIAAAFCLERSVPCIYRRQPPPEESFPGVRGGPYDPVAVRRARRGMRRSETGLAPGRHHALGLDAYAQATSPIRRYQDLVIHRQIKAFLATGAPCYGAEALQRVAATTDEAERVSRLAERGSDQYWTLRYLEREKGREIEGIVVHREPRRVEVELCETLYTVSIPPRPDHELGQRLRFLVESVNPRGPSIRLRQID